MNGLVSGGVEGFGRGLVEDENPFKMALIDSAIGTGTGGIGGLGFGYGERYLAGRKLKSHTPFDEMTKKERTQYKKIGKKYYKDYLQGTTLNKKGYGDIFFNSNNAGKNSVWGMENLPNVKKQLKKSKVGDSTNDKNEIDRYYDHLMYENDGKILDNEIEVFDDGNKNYKMTKIMEPNSKPGTIPGANQVPKNIISDYDKNLKSFMKVSKAKGQNGEPLKLKHYTINDFDEFKNNELGGHFFTNDDDYIEALAVEMGNNPNSKVIEAYLNLENPKIINAKADQFSDPTFEKPLIEAAKNEGFDSVIFKDIENPYGTTFYVPFKSNQIKSVNNQGTFDPTNPNIYKSLIGALGLEELLRRQQDNTLYNGLTNQ